MAQVASAFPTAGGLYHWSSILGGKGWGWATAWFNLGGLVFVTAAVNVGSYSLFVNFIGPMLGIDPTQLGTGHQVAGVALISSVARVAQPLRHSRDDAADRLFRLADPRGGAGAHRGDAGRRARRRLRPAVHLRRQRRRGGWRRLAGGARPRHDDVARADVAGLHGHRIRRVGAHVGRDRAGRAQRPQGDSAFGHPVRVSSAGSWCRRSCSRCPTSPRARGRAPSSSPG